MDIINQPKFKTGRSNLLWCTLSKQVVAPSTQQSALSLDLGVERASPHAVQHTQQVVPPLSGVEQADLMDNNATIFNNLMQSVKT